MDEGKGEIETVGDGGCAGCQCGVYGELDRFAPPASGETMTAFL